MTDEYWDDLEAYKAQHGSQVAEAARAAAVVSRGLQQATAAPPAELRRDVEAAIMAARMLTSYYEILHLRLLRVVYQDGSMDSQGIHNPAP